LVTNLFLPVCRFTSSERIHSMPSQANSRHKISMPSESRHIPKRGQVKAAIASSLAHSIKKPSESTVKKWRRMDVLIHYRHPCRYGFVPVQSQRSDDSYVKQIFYTDMIITRQIFCNCQANSMSSSQGSLINKLKARIFQNKP